MQAITKLAPSDINFIVKDIVVSLPSFTPYSCRGKELLDILLNQVRVAVKSDLPSDAGQGSYNPLRCYLELASFVAVERRLAHPSHLLRFYYTTLVDGLDLTRLSEEGRCSVIRDVARTLAACEEVDERAPPTAHAADLGRTSDVVFGSGDDTSLQFSAVCTMLLQASTSLFLESLNAYENSRHSLIHHRKTRGPGERA